MDSELSDRPQLGAPPTVSVIVPTYRPPPHYFRSAILSLLAQTFEDIEILIVEDPSDRSAAEILRGIEDDRLRVIRNEGRTDLPEQHNLGLRTARGRYLSRFDSDDLSEPNRIEEQVRFLEEHEEVDIVGTNLLVIDENDRVLGTRTYPESHEEILAAMPSRNPIANPSVLFRRRVFDDIGGWLTEKNTAALDYEWFSRAAVAGFRFANLQAPLVRYRLHRESIKSRRLRETIRTTLRVKRRYWRGHMNVRDWVVYLAEHLLLLLPTSLVYRLFVRFRLRS